MSIIHSMKQQNQGKYFRLNMLRSFRSFSFSKRLKLLKNFHVFEETGCQEQKHYKKSERILNNISRNKKLFKFPLFYRAQSQSMGECFSSSSYQNTLPISGQDLNLSFSDFLKANTGEVYEEYHFTAWIYRSVSSIIRWAEHRRSKVKRIVKIVDRNTRTQGRVMNQINNLGKLDHPSIIKLHELFIDKQFIYLIFQPVEGKQIYNPIVGVEHNVLRNLQNIMKQILLGLQYCHSRGIAHCNLMPEHIIIIKENKDIYVKIIGFGESFNFADILKKQKEQKESQKKKQQIQVIHSHPPIKKKISVTFESPEKSYPSNISKQDIWSCGIIMSHVLGKIFGTVEFLTFSPMKIKQIIRQKSQNFEQSQRSIALVRYMLEKDQRKRPTASQCLHHEYFEKIIKASPWKVTIIYRSLHNFQVGVFFLQICQKLKSFLSMYLTFKESTAHQQNQFLTQFYNLDKNKDGKLQYEELLEGLKNYYNIDQNDAEEYVQQIFRNLDKNKNNCIQYSQFLLGTVNISKIIERKSIQNLFKEIDRNSDGYIDANQLREMLGSYGSLAFDQKKISYEEFEKIISGLIKK